MAPRFTVMVKTGTVTMSLRSVKPQTSLFEVHHLAELVGGVQIAEAQLGHRWTSVTSRPDERLAQRHGGSGQMIAGSSSSRRMTGTGRPLGGHLAGAPQPHRPHARRQRALDVGAAGCRRPSAPRRRGTPASASAASKMLRCGFMQRLGCADTCVRT